MKKLNLSKNLRHIVSLIAISLGMIFTISGCGPIPPGPPPRLLGPGLGPEGGWFILLLTIVGIAFWVTQQRGNVNNKSEKENTLESIVKRFDILEKRLNNLEEKISELKKQK